MMKQLSVWNVGTAVFGAFIAWMLVKQILPASVSIGGNMLLLIGLLSAGGIILAGEILIKKQALTGTAEKTVRLVSIILSLIIATMTVVNVWTWGLPNFGGVNAAMQSLTNIFTLPILAAIALIGIILNGLYWEMKEGKGTISKTVFRVAVTLLIFGALLTWLIGEQLVSQSGKALQDGARSQLSAWLNGQPSNFSVNWKTVVLGFLGLAFLLGLWKKERIRTAAMILAAVIWLPLIAWMAWGALPADFIKPIETTVAEVGKTFDKWTAPAPPPAPPAPKPWVQGSTITIDRTYDMTRVMPTEGVIFAQPSFCNVQAQGIDGIVPLFTGMGPENNIWSKTLVRPRMGQPQEMRVTVVCSD